MLWRVCERIVQEEVKLLKSCKAKDPVNVNAEMTLRKKLNQCKKANSKKGNKGGGGKGGKGGGKGGGKQGVQKDSKKKTQPSDGQNNKKIHPSSKKKARSSATITTDETKKQKKEEKEEIEEREDEDKQDQEEAHDGEDDGEEEDEKQEGAAETVVTPAGSKGSSAGKKDSKFSLQAAQKASKAKKHAETSKNDEDMQRKKAEGKAKAKTQKKDAEKEEETKDDSAVAGCGGEASEILVGKERSKLRNKLTSRAYHQTFDSHKPKKSLLKSDSKQYAKLMDKAKAKAREAHHAEGKLFDEKHPKEQPAEDGRGESDNEAAEKKKKKKVPKDVD